MKFTKQDRSYPVGAQLIGAPPIMIFNKFIGVAEQPPEADKSALGAINRPLRMAGLVC